MTAEKKYVHTILTHTYPDLDAILSVLLMKRFGHRLFDGIDEAEVKFAPAGKLPGNKSPEALEFQGMVCVDIGGGRFDTHPQGVKVDESKLDRAAADLVAEELGVLHDPCWEELVEYARLQDTKAEALQSREYLHMLTSLPTMLHGINLKYGQDSYGILDTGSHILEAIPLFREHGDPEEIGNELVKTFFDRFMNSHEVDMENPISAWKNLVIWRNKLHNEPETAFSTHKKDEIVSIKAIALGFYHKHEGDQEKAYEATKVALDAILEREVQWEMALEEFQTSKHVIVHKMRKVKLVSIESENGLLIKASRFKVKADLVIYRDPSSGSTSFLINRRGPLARFSMQYLAAKIRLAECKERKKSPHYKDLMEFGTVHDWFLHQSGNLLVRGSKKMLQFHPSKISMENLVEIAKSEIDPTHKLPVAYCPDELCYNRFCIFYDMHFKTCRHHRYQLYHTAEEAEGKSDSNK